jgi:aldose 1-epimerase
VADKGFVLEHGDWRVELDGERGGQIVRADWRGLPVLAPGRFGRVAAEQDAGCFPLVPYSNRIRNGRFQLDGREIALPPPVYAAPHALHGFGWRNAWRVEASGAGAARMQLDHAPGDWPWRYRAEQIVRVKGDTLEITLTLTNLDRSPMPAGIGLHPYFVRPARLVLTASVEGRWASAPDAPGLPVGRDAAPAYLGQPGLDHCFNGWDGHAEFSGEAGLGLKLTATPSLGNLVIYTPPGQPFFCLEPVSHVNDAANLGENANPGERLLMLLQDQTLSGQMTIEARLA